MTMGPEGAKITNASQLVFFTTATDRNPAKSSMDTVSYTHLDVYKRQFRKLGFVA